MGQHHTTSNSDVAIQQQNHHVDASTSSLSSSTQNLIEPTPPLTPRGGRKQRTASNLNLSTESLSSQSSSTTTQQSVKILLLGLNGAGKSTIIKKLKEYITAKNSLHDENLIDHLALNKTFRDIIHFHALNGIKQLILASEKLDISILPRHSEQKNDIEFAINYLSNLHFRYGEHVLTSEVANLMKLLWEQRGAKEIHSEFIEYRNQQQLIAAAAAQQQQEDEKENHPETTSSTEIVENTSEKQENQEELVEKQEITIVESSEKQENQEPINVETALIVESTENQENQKPTVESTENQLLNTEINANEVLELDENKETAIVLESTNDQGNVETSVELTEKQETIVETIEKQENQEITIVVQSAENQENSENKEPIIVVSTEIQENHKETNETREETKVNIETPQLTTPMVVPRVDTEEEDVRAVAMNANDKHFNAGEINCFTLYKDLYNLDFFMSNIDRISEFDYVPTDNDVDYCQTHLKEEKKGIEEIEFDFSGSRYIIYCVEGQNNDGRKWLFLFQGVDIVLFLCPIGDFDVIPNSLDRKNIVRESLEFFSKMCNSKWFRNTPAILLLSKWDTFREKITNTPLTFCFEDYDGDHHSYQHALKFLISKFNHVRDKEGKGLINTNIYQQFSTMDMTHEELANNLGGTVKNIRIEQKERERKLKKEASIGGGELSPNISSHGEVNSPKSPARSNSVHSPSSVSTSGSSSSGNDIKHRLFSGLLQKLKKK